MPRTRGALLTLPLLTVPLLGVLLAMLLAVLLGVAAPSSPGLGQVPADAAGRRVALAASAPGVLPAARAATYWTPRRMAAARPADTRATADDGVRWTRPSTLDAYLRRLEPGRTARPAADPGAYWAGGGVVARTTGKVFFSLGGDDYVCSGSAVDSPDRSTVLTAGHCAYDPQTATAATNWVFVPGYTAGRTPYGVFPAAALATLAAWRTRQDFDADVAFADVARNGAGVRLGDAVGGQAIAFAVARGQAADVFGYPAAPPWSGERVAHCSGVLRPDPTASPTTDQGLACSMTGGSSGGPWLAGFDRRTGRGTLVSVTSFAYADRPGVVYGPYLGADAHALYDAVSGIQGQ